MKKIRIVRVIDKNFDTGGDSYYNGSINIALLDGITDWEEVSDEDYELLKNNIVYADKKHRHFIVELEDKREIKIHLRDIYNQIEEQKRRDEEERLKYEQEKEKRKLKTKKNKKNALLKKLKADPDIMEEIIKELK